MQPTTTPSTRTATRRPSTRTATRRPNTRTSTRRPGAAALAALAGLGALGLTACGSDAEPEAVGAPIVLSSSTGTTTGTAGASGATEASTAAPSGGSSAAPSATGGAAPVAAVVRDDEANVDVEDQGGDGRSVRVDEVRLSAGTGHVVVIDPRTRQVLGSVPVRAGTARNLALTLTQPVARSGELLALVYADDGDGRFDPATDGAVVDDDDLEPVDEDFDYTLR